MQKTKIQMLSYIGEKENGQITVAPVKRTHPDRVIDFRKGKKWFVGYSISDQAAKYLAYNFKALFTLSNVELDSRQLLTIDLDMLRTKYSDLLSDTGFNEVLADFMPGAAIEDLETDFVHETALEDDIDSEKDTAKKRRGRPKK